MLQILTIRLYQNKYLGFLFIVFFIFIGATNLFAEGKIATIVKSLGNSYAINLEDKKRLLNLYDAIYLNEEIITDDKSTLVIQYLDNSTIILKKSSSITLTNFISSEKNNLFLAKINKGSAIIESGKIAKKSNGKMEIKLPTMILDIKGTRFNIGQKEDGVYDVGLSEDSFGNIGSINVSFEGGSKTLYDPKQVISTNSNQVIERLQTIIEKNELDEVTQDFVEVKIINEDRIQKNLESKLINGKIIDINNDGQIDLLDVDIIRENIVTTKQETIDFIVENSRESNTNFLSNVLNKSDEKNVGQSMNKIFETKNDLLTPILSSLSSTNNKFITSSDSEINNSIKEKIFTQLLSENIKQEKKSKNIELMAKIITKSDLIAIEKIVNIVEISNSKEGNSNLSLQILSSVADKQAEDEISLENEEQTQVNRLIEEAIASAAENNSEENSALIANVITKSNVETIAEVVDVIKKNNLKNPNAGLSLQVLNEVQIVTNNESLAFESNKQTQVNRLLEEARAAAAAEAALVAEVAAVLAAAEAAALAAQEAADLLALQILEQIALDLLNEADRLQGIADGLTEQCSAAGLNVTAMQLAQSNAESLSVNAEVSATQANDEWVEANNIVINFISPTTSKEQKNYAIAQNNANALLAVLNQRLNEAQEAQNNATMAATSTTTAQTNETSVCAKADAAQLAANETLSEANSAT